MTKAKKLVTDFSKQPLAAPPMTIDGEIAERIDKHEYLRVILYNKLKLDSDMLNLENYLFRKMPLYNILFKKRNTDNNNKQ